MNPQFGDNLAANMFAPLFKGELTELHDEDPPSPKKKLLGPEALLAIWIAGSRNGTLEYFSGPFKNISDTLTTHVRQHSDTNQSEPSLGDVHYHTVCVNVRWPWTAYSGAIVGLTLLFFTWVVLQARRDQI